MSMTYLWPDEALVILRENLTSKSASAIVQLLPLDKNGRAPTRSAIIGKCHRLGWRLGDPEKVSAQNRLSAQRALGRGQTKGLAGSAAMKGAPKVKPGFKPPKEPPVAPNIPATQHFGAYAILGLDAHSCHWPVGDPRDDEFRFCCAPMKFGETYCAHHKHLSIDHVRMARARRKLPGEPQDGRRKASRVGRTQKMWAH